MGLRVVKFGGSSLSTTTYVERLRRWLARQTPADTVIVVGGGAAVREVAAEQLRHEFCDSKAHWQCIDHMQRNADRLLREMSETNRLERTADLPTAGRQNATWILDPRRFMDEDAETAAPLPESWDVSSDSIAARVAEQMAADELVLLKSRLPRQLTRLGKYVDSYFSAAARKLTAIRFVNLRDPEFAEVRWR